MGITVTGRLNKDARQFAAGESTGFSIRIGVQYYDRKLKEKSWTNYQGVVFAKQGAQFNFYSQTLVEGAVIELTAPTAKVDSFDGNNGPILTIELNDCQLGAVYAPQGQAPQQQAAPAQQAKPQVAPGMDNFDSDIPF